MNYEEGVQAAPHYPNDLFALIVDETTDTVIRPGERIIKNPRIIHRYKR